MLPMFPTKDQALSLLQTRWASILEPLLRLPLSGGIILPRVSLASGSNIIPHKLGRKLQGWIVVRNRASSTIYDTQDSNAHPESTLLLTASANTTVDLLVY